MADKQTRTPGQVHPDFAHWKPSDPRLGDLLRRRLHRAKAELAAAIKLLHEQEDSEQFFLPETQASLRAEAVEVADYAESVRRLI